MKPKLPNEGITYRCLAIGSNPIGFLGCLLNMSRKVVSAEHFILEHHSPPHDEMPENRHRIRCAPLSSSPLLRLPSAFWRPDIFRTSALRPRLRRRKSNRPR